MKTILVVLVAAAALSGCIIAPIEPAPMVYGPPAAVHVYPHHHHHRYRHRHWR
jgi:hypothetical protein